MLLMDLQLGANNGSVAQSGRILTPTLLTFLIILRHVLVISSLLSSSLGDYRLQHGYSLVMRTERVACKTPGSNNYRQDYSEGSWECLVISLPSKLQS